MCSPLILPPASAKLSRRPFSSHCLKAEGIETARFVSILGAQNVSSIWTAVKGTGDADCGALCLWQETRLPTQKKPTISRPRPPRATIDRHLSKVPRMADRVAYRNVAGARKLRHAPHILEPLISCYGPFTTALHRPSY